MNHNARLVFDEIGVASRDVTLMFLPHRGDAFSLPDNKDLFFVNNIEFRHDKGERTFYPVIYLGSVR